MNTRSTELVVPRVLCAAMLTGSLFGAAVAARQAKDVKIDDDGQTVMVDCRETAVVVNGDDNTVTITGQCSALVVNGDDNTITAASAKDVTVVGDDNTISLDAVARITAVGDDNTIRWKKGAGGSNPEVANTGDDNKITQGG